MSLLDLRFLTIYLEKINARDIETRSVEFKIEEFIKIMNIDKVNIWKMKEVTDSLLCKIVHIDTEDGGYESFQLFKKCKLYKNDNEEWIIQINASDDALPLMFDFKGNYFKYQLWNCLGLKSSNQIAMYEILKQYEKIGSRTITIEDLKILLGISNKEYPIWADFKKRVLDSCQTALKENTDIYFDYEPIKKGRKFNSIKFTIHKNKDFNDPLGLKEFIGEHIENFEDDILEEVEKTDIDKLLKDATNNEFSSQEELDIIFDKVAKLNLEDHMYGPDIAKHHFVNSKYLEFKLKEKDVKGTYKEIKKPFKYFISMLQ